MVQEVLKQVEQTKDVLVIISSKLVDVGQSTPINDLPYTRRAGFMLHKPTNLNCQNIDFECFFPKGSPPNSCAHQA
jgi:hypothetical protein